MFKTRVVTRRVAVRNILMRAFVTVGATVHFDLLIQTVLSQEVLEALVNKGFHHLVIQTGPSKQFPEGHEERDGLSIDFWKLKPSLKEDFQASDLIMSHAGESGTRSTTQQSF
jgi:beta-1,4-N-acetylglucosaminyltransferase